MSEEFIPFCKPSIGDEEIAEVVACLKSGWLTTAGRAKKFESDFAEYVDAKFAVALNSCTAALHLALEAVGLQAGELVLVPSMTFAATAEVVRYFNATPVLVDCREDDFCMDMVKAETTIKNIIDGKPVKGVPKDHKGLRAILPVHFAGQIADVLTCRRLADEYGLSLVEDCAHCCPAFYRGDNDEWLMVGKSADIACFSFYANKTITTGEGGMAVTNNETWADRIRVMSLHGISKDAWKRFSKSGSWFYEIVAPGFKYNIPDVTASIGIHQLRKADEFLKNRRRVVESYTAKLADIPSLILPFEKSDRRHSWHLYIARVDQEKTGIDRNAFIELLKERNIGTSVHYIPLHLHPYYVEKYGFEPDDFPVTNKLFSQIVSLPLYPDLSEDKIGYICESIKNILT